MMEIHLLKKVDMAGCTFVEGFPGAGLVGPMSISYMVNKLNFEYVGYLEGDVFPPLISIHNDMPLPPCRLYYSKKFKMVALFAEASMVSEKSIYDVSDRLYDFIKKNGISRIISISGVPVENPNPQDVFGIASTEKLIGKFSEFGLKRIGNGVAAGIGALVLMRSSIDALDDINILVPVNPQIIDPRYAELALKSLNKILKVNIDTGELDKEAQVVEERIKDIIKRSKEAKNPYEKKESGPSMYA